MDKITNRKVVVLNQAVNYLTVDLCNAFYKRFDTVALITGNIHEQERVLDKGIEVTYITKWVASPMKKKLISNLKATAEMFWLLKTKYSDYEVFFLSVPPMGYLINIFLSNRFSMLIWDIFPDGLKISGIKESHPVYKIWASLNKRSFPKSYRFYTISDTMADLLGQYINKKEQLITPIWSVFQNKKRVLKEENIFIEEHKLQDKFIVQYSGNIGRSHKVELVVELAERMKEDKNIFFQIIGRGPRVEYLKNLVQEKKLINCQFLPFQADEMFLYSLSAADMGVVILDEISSKGSVPSKSYNLMSLGIPSLYIASDESELFNYAKKYQHAKCFTENKLDQVVTYILKMSSDKKTYNIYVQNNLKAAQDFKLDNADRIVELYLKE